jgi:hypothetical protein
MYTNIFHSPLKYTKLGYLVCKYWYHLATLPFKLLADFFHIHTRVARWFVFKPKIPNLGKFWRALEWKMLVYFMVI